MKISQLFYISGILFFFCSGAIAKQKIKWLVAHGPIEVVESGVNFFRSELEKNSPQEFEVILDKSMIEAYEPTSDRNKLALEAIQNGDVQIGQVYASTLIKQDKRFGIFDVPFLVKDHDHALKLFQSSPMLGLLEDLKNINLVGVQYTYSGGFRIIVTQAPLKLDSISKFKNKKFSYIGPEQYPIANEFYGRLGAKTKLVKKEQTKSSLDERKIDGFESVYSRVENLKEAGGDKYYLNETYHNLQVTVLVINKEFFSKLTDIQKKSLFSAAEKAAEAERQFSISYSEHAKESLIKAKTSVVIMSEQEKLKLRKLALSGNKQTLSYFPKDFLKTILEVF